MTLMTVLAISEIVQLDVTGVSTLSAVFLTRIFRHVLPFGSDKPTQAAEYGRIHSEGSLL